MHVESSNPRAQHALPDKRDQMAQLGRSSCQLCHNEKVLQDTLACFLDRRNWFVKLSESENMFFKSDIEDYTKKR